VKQNATEAAAALCDEQWTNAWKLNYFARRQAVTSEVIVTMLRLRTHFEIPADIFCAAQAWAI
jgi:hypothetical protein